MARRVPSRNSGSSTRFEHALHECVADIADCLERLGQPIAVVPGKDHVGVAYRRDVAVSTIKTVAVVQSSTIPWKGYFDLINSADESRTTT
jgi:hypothetical protein